MEGLMSRLFLITCSVERSHAIFISLKEESWGFKKHMAAEYAEIWLRIVVEGDFVDFKI